MKIKLLFILLSALFIMPMSAMPHKRHRHKVNTKIINSHSKAIQEINENIIIDFRKHTQYYGLYGVKFVTTMIFLIY